MHVNAYAELWLDEHLLARIDRSGTTLTSVELDAGACMRMQPRWVFFDGISESLSTIVSDTQIRYDLTGVLNFAGHNGATPVAGTIQINPISDPRFDLKKIYVSADTLWRCGGTSDVTFTFLTGAGLPYAFCDTTTFPVKVNMNAPIDINFIVNGNRVKSFTMRSDSINGFHAIQVEWDIARAPMNQDGRLAATITAEALGVRDSATIALECSTPPVVFTGGRIQLRANPLETPYTERADFLADVTDTSGNSIPFPPTITFKYEIIEGQAWGLLYDFNSDAFGTMLEGLPTAVSFFPNGNSPYDEKRVVVKCTASDTTITSGTAVLKVLPGRLKVGVMPATVNYGEIAQLSVEGLILNGVVSPLDPTATITYEIVQSNDAGYLSVNGSTNNVDVINDVGPAASFVALEETPQPIATQVIIKVTAKTTVIEGKALEDTPTAKGKKKDKIQLVVEDIGAVKVRVEKLACPIVTITPSRIAPGDTVAIDIQANVDGTPTPYPADQTFSIGFLQGAQFGMIRSVAKNQTAQSFTDTPLPFQFIAANAIDGDSVTVQIRAVPTTPPVTAMGANTKSNAVQTAQQREERFLVPLANPVCLPPVASVVVKKVITFATCIDNPQISIVSRYAESPELDCSKGTEIGSSYVNWSFPSSKATLDVCQDKFTGKLRTQTIGFNIDVLYGICPRNMPVGAKIWNSILEITPSDDPCSILKQFDDRIKVLQNGNRQNLELSSSIVKNILKDEIIIHEEKHVQSMVPALKKALSEVISRNKNEYISDQTAQNLSTDPLQMGLRAKRFLDKVNAQYNALRQEELSERLDELAAQQAQSETLTVLRDDLKNRFSNCN